MGGDVPPPTVAPHQSPHRTPRGGQGGQGGKSAPPDRSPRDGHPRLPTVPIGGGRGPGGGRPVSGALWMGGVLPPMGIRGARDQGLGLIGDPLKPPRMTPPRPLSIKVGLECSLESLGPRPSSGASPRGIVGRGWVGIRPSVRWGPHRRPTKRHGGTGAAGAGKARRPTGPRETGTPGHPRYL